MYIHIYIYMYFLRVVLKVREACRGLKKGLFYSSIHCFESSVIYNSHMTPGGVRFRLALGDGAPFESCSVTRRVFMDANCIYDNQIDTHVWAFTLP